jgi:hypothetical protein
VRVTASAFVAQLVLNALPVGFVHRERFLKLRE